MTEASAIGIYTATRVRPLLGTFVAIEAAGAVESQVRRAMDAAFHAIATLGEVMHPDRPGGDLHALRYAPPGTSIEVHPWTAEVLQLARLVWEKSDGVFDVCLPEAPGCTEDITVLDATHVSSRRVVHVDLGGIAKGYAVDRAVDLLQQHGCEFGLVNAGGDLRLFGREQRVLMRASDHEESMILQDCALAVSDVRTIHGPPEHRGYYRRGSTAVARGNLAWVRADRAAIADALTKCLLMGEGTKTPALLSEFGAAGRIL